MLFELDYLLNSSADHQLPAYLFILPGLQAEQIHPRRQTHHR